MLRGRELERQKDNKPVSSSSKFGDWMGGLMVGTPFSPEAGSTGDDNNNDDDDDEDLLVRLARRMEERREELAQDLSAVPAEPAQQGSASTLDSTVNSFFAEKPSVPSENSPPVRKRRRRKDGSSPI